MELEISSQILGKRVKYQVSSKSTQWEPNYSMQMDGQT
jgi:hypothetical protein